MNIPKTTPDPYVFATARGLAIWHSTDLKTWTYRGRVFEESVPDWAKQKIRESGSVWAPDIHRMNGRYYLAYHAIDAREPRARVLQIRRLNWQDDWPAAGELLTHPPTEQEAQPPLVGRWDQRVGDRDYCDIFLEPSGSITGSGGDAFWELDQDQLLLKWQAPSAPGGFWIDRVKLSEDQRSYSGQNQHGIRIEGGMR